MSSGKQDYYAILGVFRDATLDEIKRAYFEAAQRLHPDKNTAAGETELFLEIQQAYEILSNPKRRNMYDATLPPEINDNAIVKMETFFSRGNLVNSDEPQLIYAMLEVTPRGETKSVLAPPLNICLVLDRSTSMKGEKMDTVKSTAVQILRSLRPEDVFSVVSFSDRAEVVIPAGQKLELSQKENSIQMMQTSGGTEIYNGLRAGIDEVRRSLTSGRVNHIILLTDGHTYGDEHKCMALAEEAAALSIGISGMGIGSEWNDIFLDALASKTGGSSAYIAKPKDIQHLLVDKFKALTNTYVDDVILEHEETPGVQIKYAFRMQPDIGQIQIERPMHLGPILRDTPMQVIFEFIVDSSALKQNPVKLIGGSLKTFIVARSAPVSPIRVSLARSVQEEASTESPPLKLMGALSKLNLYRMQERARAAADQGNYETASRNLNSLATHLLAQGEIALAKTVLFEADNLEKMKSWSAGSNQKDIKYKTRALLLSSAKEKEQ